MMTNIEVHIPLGLKTQTSQLHIQVLLHPLSQESYNRKTISHITAQIHRLSSNFTPSDSIELTNNYQLF